MGFSEEEMTRYTGRVSEMVEKNGRVVGSFVGQDDHGLNLLGHALRTLRKANWPSDDIAELRDICLSGSYEWLIFHLGMCLKSP